jgi:cell wall-associated NlpC family hydrolase
MRIPRATLLTVCSAALAAGVLAGDLSAASPKERLQAKQAQAQQVLAQISTLDRRFEASVEAWHGAQYELAVTKHQLVQDRAELRVAERQRQIAQKRLRDRVVAIYESSDPPTTLGIFLGSNSVSDILDELDAARHVADADHQLAAETTAARNRYAKAAERTSALEREREAAVSQRATERAQIGAMLAQRKRLLASVQSEVAKLQAEEARRQAELAAQARARLAAEQAAQRAAAERQREQAAAAAKAQAAAANAPATTTTAPAATTTAAADPPPPTTTAPAATTTSAPPPPTTTTTPAPTPSGSPGAGHPEAATIALRYLGIPYLWGGASPSTGFDCSGLVMYVYAQLGISLPHFAAAQYAMGKPVSRDQLQPGDLVFFDALNHVGINIGGGQFVHAPETGDVVKITALSDFGAGYVGARRI